MCLLDEYVLVFIPCYFRNFVWWNFLKVHNFPKIENFMLPSLVTIDLYATWMVYNMIVTLVLLYEKGFVNFECLLVFQNPSFLNKETFSLSKPNRQVSQTFDCLICFMCILTCYIHKETTWYVVCLYELHFPKKETFPT